MQKTKYTLFDGMTVKQTKSLNPWDVDDLTGWESTEKRTTEGEYFKSVPWLYRGVLDRANNVGRMPFSIMLNGKEIDSSADYQNKLEFLPNPKALFKKLEMSIAMTGRAYLRLELNPAGYIKSAKYMIPTSITEEFDKESGELIKYVRTIGTRKIDLNPDQVAAFYDTDYLTENGPPASSAAMAALISAGVLNNVDKFVSNFFQRGAIKATVFTTRGVARDEAEKLQKWVDKFVSGVKNAWSSRVLNGEEVKPVVIGEGLESLQNDGLTKERRQDIATALGVPESRMWSSAANYATRVEDEKSYFNSTIIPDCELIAEAYKTQIFNAAHHLDGYSLVFQTETLDVFQADAADQAAALASLVNTKDADGNGIPLIIGIDLVGLEITDDQRKELIAKSQKKEETPATNEVDQTGGRFINQDDINSALRQWQRKATKRLKEGEGAACEFKSDLISPEIRAIIEVSLPDCKTAEDVKRVFAEAKPVNEAEQLKRAMDWLEKNGG